MSYGLEVFNEVGQPRVKMNSKITRLVLVRHLPAGESGSVSVPYLSGKPAAAFAIKLVDSNSDTMQKVGHLASIQGSVVLWQPTPPPTPNLGYVPSRLMVYVYG